MAIWELFRALHQIGYLVPLDREAIKVTGADKEKHATYHRRVVLTGGIFALLGLPVSGLLLAELARESGGKIEGHDRIALVAVPLMAALAGFSLGVAIACLFAPASFLAGPVGQKWMRFIGTRSIFLARVVCLLICLVLGLLPWLPASSL